MAGETREILIVGHMPNLPRVLTLLVTGAQSPLLSFPLHGAIALEATGERWTERWRLWMRVNLAGPRHQLRI